MPAPGRGMSGSPWDTPGGRRSFWYWAAVVAVGVMLAAAAPTLFAFALLAVVGLEAGVVVVAAGVVGLLAALLGGGS